MFVVKWRNRTAGWKYRFVVVVGLHRYPTRVAAEKQIALWARIFPANTYYIE